MKITTQIPRSGQAILRTFFAVALSTAPLFAAAPIWTGAGGDADWSTTANWDTGLAPVPGVDSLTFNGTTQQSNNNDLAAGSYTTVTFNNGGFTLNGPTQLGLSGTVFSTGNNALNAGLVLGGAGTKFTQQAGGGTLTINNGVNFNGLTLQENSTGTTIFNGSFTGGGTLNILSLTPTQLAGDNSAYTGTINVSRFAKLTNAQGLGGASTTVNLNNAVASASIDLNGLNVSGVNVTMTGGHATNLGQLINTSGTTAIFSGNITTSASNDLGVSGPLTLSGKIGGGGGLTKTAGGNVVTISGTANDYTGNTTINGGYLVTGVNQALPASTIVTTTGTGALDLNGKSMTIAGLSGTTGSVYNFPLVGTLSTLTLNVSAGPSLTYGGSIGTTFTNMAIVKSGAGTQVFSGNNTYTGPTTVSEGTLLTTKAAALPGYNSASKVVFNGGTVGVQVGGAGWTTGEVDALLANATKTSGALGIDTTNATLTQWTAFTTANFGSTLGLTKLGGNALNLNQANTYNGNTTISGGYLVTQVNQALPASTIVTTTDTGALDLNGKSMTIAGLSGTSGSVYNYPLVGTLSTLTLNVSAGPSLTYGGSIGTTFTNMAIVKSGAGTQVLSGNNTYAGGTTVTAGTLLVSNTAGSGIGTGDVTVNGGTLGGSGSFTGGVTVNAGGTLAPGSSIESLGAGAVTLTGGTLAFELNTSTVNADLLFASDANCALTLTSGVPSLSITDLGADVALADGIKLTLISYNAAGGWNGGIFSGYADGSTFTLGSNTWQINYADLGAGSNFAADATLFGDRFVTITTVPEPATWALAGLGLALTMALRRRCGGKRGMAPTHHP